MRTLLRIAPAFLLLLAAGVAVATERQAADAASIEISAMNGVYEDLDQGLAPIQQGPLTIRISSPEHRLVVHGNRLTLEPKGGGRLRAAVETELEGAGRLHADVEGSGLANRFTDDVEVPRQRVRVAGEIYLRRHAAGYLITTAEAIPPVRLEIRSDLAGQVVGLCQTLAVLPFLAVSCDALETALSAVTVPMPGADQEFLLLASSLTETERAFFDAHAAPAEPPPPPAP